MTAPLRILYVDDYPLDRELVRDALEKEHGGFSVVMASTRPEFEARLAEGGYDLVLSDFNILGFEGLHVLDSVHALYPGIPVVIVTGTGSEEIAVEAMKRGAADYVLKTPREIQRLPQTIYAVLDKQRLTLEKAQARAEAEAERDRLTLLMDNLPDTLYFKDRQARFTRANHALARQFGLDDPAGLLGKTEFDLLPNDQTREHLAQELLLLESGQPLLDQVLFRPRADGTARWLSTTTVPIRDSAGAVTGLVGIARDITERMHAEQEIQRQLERLAALRQIDQAIMGSFDLGLVLNILLDQAAQLLQVDAADILVFQPQTHLLRFEAGRGFHTNAIRRTQTRLGEGLAGHVAAERRVRHVPDLAGAGGAFSRAQLLADESFVSYAGAPLLSKGQIKGVLEVFHRAPLEPDPEWRDFLETLAGQAAIAIDNVQLFDGLQRSNLELGAGLRRHHRRLVARPGLARQETEGHTRRVTEIDCAAGARARACARRSGAGAPGRAAARYRQDGRARQHPAQARPADRRRMGGRCASHPQLAYEMLSTHRLPAPGAGHPLLPPRKMGRQRLPARPEGEQIPLAARIFAVVDVWDALRSDRPYRAAWPEADVRAYLREQAGRHFDPRAVNAFLNLPEDDGHL